MSADNVIFRGGRIFDGVTLRTGLAARFEGGALAALSPADAAQADPADGAQVVDLGDDILAPGYVDLQVNGGDGVMFNDAPTVETLSRIARAHRRLGTRLILPTLITDTAEKTRAAIAAATEAIAQGVAGIAGLHLEGPHLSVARKGAHEARFIRPMMADDLDVLLAAARSLPALMITLAPENTTPDQVRALTSAGAIVSLGHTDTDFDTAMAFQAAGARCATHLFNAMSQATNRAPGVVGAVLTNPALGAGLIADGVHVHPATMRLAWAANRAAAKTPEDPTGRIFLVTDAMAVAGTDQLSFTLEGREIRRENGRLTLADGTLAGADLDLTRAIRILHRDVGVDLDAALRAAITHPAAMIGRDIFLTPDRSPNRPPALADMIRIRADLSGLAPLV